MKKKITTKDFQKIHEQHLIGEALITFKGGIKQTLLNNVLKNSNVSEAESKAFAKERQDYHKIVNRINRTKEFIKGDMMGLLFLSETIDNSSELIIDEKSNVILRIVSSELAIILVSRAYGGILSVSDKSNKLPDTIEYKNLMAVKILSEYKKISDNKKPVYKKIVPVLAAYLKSKK